MHVAMFIIKFLVEGQSHKEGIEYSDNVSVVKQ